MNIVIVSEEALKPWRDWLDGLRAAVTAGSRKKTTNRMLSDAIKKKLAGWQCDDNGPDESEVSRFCNVDPGALRRWTSPASRRVEAFELVLGCKKGAVINKLRECGALVEEEAPSKPWHPAWLSVAAGQIPTQWLWRQADDKLGAAGSSTEPRHGLDSLAEALFPGAKSENGAQATSETLPGGRIVFVGLADADRRWAAAELIAVLTARNEVGGCSEPQPSADECSFEWWPETGIGPANAAVAMHPRTLQDPTHAIVHANTSRIELLTWGVAEIERTVEALEAAGAIAETRIVHARRWLERAARDPRLLGPVRSPSLLLTILRLVVDSKAPNDVPELQQRVLTAWWERTRSNLAAESWKLAHVTVDDLAEVFAQRLVSASAWGPWTLICGEIEAAFAPLCSTPEALLADAWNQLELMVETAKPTERRVKLDQLRAMLGPQSVAELVELLERAGVLSRHSDERVDVVELAMARLFATRTAGGTWTEAVALTAEIIELAKTFAGWGHGLDALLARIPATDEMAVARCRAAVAWAVAGFDGRVLPENSRQQVASAWAGLVVATRWRLWDGNLVNPISYLRGAMSDTLRADLALIMEASRALAGQIPDLSSDDPFGELQAIAPMAVVAAVAAWRDTVNTLADLRPGEPFPTGWHHDDNSDVYWLCSYVPFQAAPWLKGSFELLHHRSDFASSLKAIYESLTARADAGDALARAWLAGAAVADDAEIHDEERWQWWLNAPIMPRLRWMARTPQRSVHVELWRQILRDRRGLSIESSRAHEETESETTFSTRVSSELLRALKGALEALETDDRVKILVESIDGQLQPRLGGNSTPATVLMQLMAATNAREQLERVAEQLDAAIAGLEVVFPANESTKLRSGRGAPIHVVWHVPTEPQARARKSSWGPLSLAEAELLRSEVAEHLATLGLPDRIRSRFHHGPNWTFGAGALRRLRIEMCRERLACIDVSNVDACLRDAPAASLSPWVHAESAAFLEPLMGFAPDLAGAPLPFDVADDWKIGAAGTAARLWHTRPDLSDEARLALRVLYRVCRHGVITTPDEAVVSWLESCATRISMATSFGPRRYPIELAQLHAAVRATARDAAVRLLDDKLIADVVTGLEHRDDVSYEFDIMATEAWEALLRRGADAVKKVADTAIESGAVVAHAEVMRRTAQFDPLPPWWLEAFDRMADDQRRVFVATHVPAKPAARALLERLLASTSDAIERDAWSWQLHCADPDHETARAVLLGWLATDATVPLVRHLFHGDYRTSERRSPRRFPKGPSFDQRLALAREAVASGAVSEGALVAALRRTFSAGIELAAREALTTIEDRTSVADIDMVLRTVASELTDRENGETAVDLLAEIHTTFGADPPLTGQIPKTGQLLFWRTVGYAADLKVLDSQDSRLSKEQIEWTMNQRAWRGEIQTLDAYAVSARAAVMNRARPSASALWYFEPLSQHRPELVNELAEQALAGPHAGLWRSFFWALAMPAGWRVKLVRLLRQDSP